MENVEVLPVDGLISDHDLVTFDLKIVRPKATRKSITFRNYRNIDQDTIANEIDFRMAFADILDSSAEGLTQHYIWSLKKYRSNTSHSQQNTFLSRPCVKSIMIW